MFYEVNRTTSLGDDTFVSSATMRAHVRAIDSSEDSLLRTYRNAAVDYLQNLSDRVLGLSTAKVLLDYYEFRAPFRIQKLQDITSINKVEYLKDGVYRMYDGYTVPDDDANITVTAVITGTGPWQVTLRNTAPFSGRLFKYNFWSEEYEAVQDVAAVVSPYEHVLTVNEAGIYKYVEVTGPFAGEAIYYAIDNGLLFKHTALYDQYPAQFDFSELCELVDCDTDTKFRVTVSCGTDWADLPMQYTQAALLLIGHYYNMREAEAIGGITTEIKEGVRRLVMSVRQY